MLTAKQSRAKAADLNDRVSIEEERSEIAADSAKAQIAAEKLVKKLDAGGEPIRGEREIIEDQAEIVRRIFREYVAGKGPQKIAADLEKLLADGLDDIRFARAAPFDLVLANILPDPLCRMAGPLAPLIAPARDVLYLGRGLDYPMALEGALKLKEISYIHAEGYASGEMKHGPIALIDEAVPVIVLAPSGPLFDKTVSNMQEVQARGGKVVLVSDYDGVQAAGEGCIATITMPKVHPLIAPMVYAVPVQLLAYHVAVLKGTRLMFVRFDGPTSDTVAGVDVRLTDRGRLRTVRQAPDGSLWVTQDSSPGALLRLVPATA